VRRALRVLVAAAALLSFGLAVAGCGSGGGTSSSTASTPAAPNTITIKNFMFSPTTLTVSAGAKVTVRNTDSTTHTLTSSTKLFDTGNVAAGATTTFTAPGKPGSYTYICDIHQYMQSTLTVK
jgi:plastocyanin